MAGAWEWHGTRPRYLASKASKSGTRDRLRHDNISMVDKVHFHSSDQVARVKKVAGGARNTGRIRLECLFLFVSPYHLLDINSSVSAESECFVAAEYNLYASSLEDPTSGAV